MKFTVTHNNKTFSFDTADELYIFGLAIELDVTTNLKIDITTFIKRVKQCYEEDCKNTPLKPFVLFITRWWNELHRRDIRFIVNNFYETQNQ